MALGVWFHSPGAVSQIALPTRPAVYLILNLGLKKTADIIATERMFRRTFESATKSWPYSIHIVSDPSALTLSQITSSQWTHAMFWVGHSASTAAAQGLVSVAGIFDSYGADISPILGAPHPNLRFLGVVGCRAQVIMDRLKQAGRFRFNPQLRIETSDDLVYLDPYLNYQPEFLRTLTSSFHTLVYLRSWQETAPYCKTGQSLRRAMEIEITRTPTEASGHLSSVLVLNNGRLVGVLPGFDDSGRAQVSHLQMEWNRGGAVNNLDLLFFPTAQGSPIETIGAIQVRIENENYVDAKAVLWTPFRSRKTGQLIGSDRRLLLYRGPAVEESRLSTLRVDGCL